MPRRDPQSRPWLARPSHIFSIYRFSLSRKEFALRISEYPFLLADRIVSSDLKATALLKLIYLEMLGYDMSWASFHVLEVMSSAKYHQKRVGYLGAVQSFRPDTEVLMLATNLLKKVLFSLLRLDKQIISLCLIYFLLT